MFHLSFSYVLDPTHWMLGKLDARHTFSFHHHDRAKTIVPLKSFHEILTFQKIRKKFDGIVEFFWADSPCSDSLLNLVEETHCGVMWVK